MPMSVDLRLGADNTQAMSALTQVQSKMKDVGNTARSELAQKLKTVFEVTAIEEAVRRTAQWAQEIEQTSKQLGISTEALQTLQTIANKTGLPTDAVTGMFEHIAKARDEAIDGNTDLISSFQALGITMGDLMSSTKSELFGKVLKGLPDNIQNANNFIRQSAKQVTGDTPENFINAVTGEVGPAGGFSNYQSQQKEAGAVLPENTINELSTTWTGIIQDLREFGSQLKPIVVIILGILRTFTEALVGLGQAVQDVVGFFDGTFSGNEEKIKKSLLDFGGLFANLGVGLIKTIATVFDLIANSITGMLSSFLRMIPGMGKLADRLEKASHITVMKNFGRSVEGDSQNFLGISKTTQERGQAIGNAALMVGPGGIEKIGVSLEKGASVASGIMKKGIMDSAKDATTGAIKNIVKKVKTEDVPVSEAKVDPIKKPIQLSKKEKDDILEKLGFKRMYNTMSPYTSAGGVVSSVVSGIVASKNVNAGTTPADVRPILPNKLYAQQISSGGNPMLKMGGTFGSGFQSRLIQLNDHMLRELVQINKYMSFMANPVSGANTNPNLPPGT